ncbi:phospholipase D-like domain-containing protein [Frateuria hangzhouensis]|uniref:phospholipase D-like domain-containing protein n=1 Tax=Frateuria hangzhouensis TaxID=2995589 RepID=UPI002260FC0A|nr:phospholipase D family protein [Frateuria sp. STR12]MCX7513409.1 phospholipase D family protein [Frateuria sp. STR12]
MPLPRLALFFLLAATVLLDGCTLSRAQIRRADAVVAATTPDASACSRADRCAQPSPLLDAATRALGASTPARPHHLVALLGASEPALVARLSLIRAARRTIDVQTYIWDQDDVGQLVLDELVRAARRGVRVRILADQLFSFGDLAVLDRLARASPNLQVRLYNPTFHEASTSPLEWAAGIACCFFRFNQRMHNKVLVVDGTAGITGGRNYQDRYFDWDDDFDYVDRDVLVGGPAAQSMAESFALFWRHKRSVPLTHLRDVNHYILAHPAAPGWPAPEYDHPQRVYRVEQEADDGAWLRAHVLADSLQAGKVEFFSDLPGKTDQPLKRQARQFTAHVMQMVGSARQEVVLQTPYLVMSRRARRIFEYLHQLTPPPRIVVSTNSLASTDAFAVYAVSYKHRKRYLKDYGFEIYELKPHASDAAAANARASLEWVGEGARASGDPAHDASERYVGTEVRGLLGSHGSSRRPAPLVSEGRRFALHAKSIVVDDRFAMVGSHNFDPRSDHYNTEAGVIVYDRRFAEQLRRAILRDIRPRNAWVIAPRRPVVPLLTKLNQAIGDISESLPLFDFWPYRYATSYQLKEGCTPMRPSDPAFYSCYEPVGDFPDVALSPKLIYTRLITAFGSSASGIL